MNRTSAVRFQGTSRVHIGLAVTDLERSIRFYSALLGEDPVKRRPGYAKFEPREPSLNLSLNESTVPLPPRRGGSEHYGLQVQSGEAVDSLAERLRAAGLAVRSEERTSCCYAVQDKAWVVDPDGNPWEVFVVLEADAPQRSAVGCCGPAEGAQQPEAAASGASCCGGGA